MFIFNLSNLLELSKIEREENGKVIYVGDTLKDKIESEKANVKFIHASYGFGVIENDEFKITNLLELPPLVDELFSGDQRFK